MLPTVVLSKIVKLKNIFLLIKWELVPNFAKPCKQLLHSSLTFNKQGNAVLRIKTTFSTTLKFLNSMFVSMSCTNNPPHNDQCDITLSKAWSSSSKPFLKSMHYMPQSVGFTLWSELTLKASRLWAFVTLELLHNAKNKCIKQIWKGYFALSRDITAKAALEPFICTILQCLWLRFS